MKKSIVCMMGLLAGGIGLLFVMLGCKKEVTYNVPFETFDKLYIQMPFPYTLIHLTEPLTLVALHQFRSPDNTKARPIVFASPGHPVYDAAADTFLLKTRYEPGVTYNWIANTPPAGNVRILDGQGTSSIRVVFEMTSEALVQDDSIMLTASNGWDPDTLRLRIEATQIEPEFLVIPDRPVKAQADAKVRVKFNIPIQIPDNVANTSRDWAFVESNNQTADPAEIARGTVLYQEVDATDPVTGIANKKSQVFDIPFTIGNARNIDKKMGIIINDIKATLPYGGDPIGQRTPGTGVGSVTEPNVIEIDNTPPAIKIAEVDLLHTEVQGGYELKISLRIELTEPVSIVAAKKDPNDPDSFDESPRDPRLKIFGVSSETHVIQEKEITITKDHIVAGTEDAATELYIEDIDLLNNAGGGAVFNLSVGEPNDVRFHVGVRLRDRAFGPLDSENRRDNGNQSSEDTKFGPIGGIVTPVRN